MSSVWINHKLRFNSESFTLNRYIAAFSVCAGTRQASRGRYGAAGGGNPARGHCRPRLLPLQHKAPDGTLSYPFDRERGRENANDPTIGAETEGETSDLREEGKGITAPEGENLTSFTILLFPPPPSSRPLASLETARCPVFTHAHSPSAPPPFSIFFSYLSRSYYSTMLPTILIFVRK